MFFKAKVGTYLLFMSRLGTIFFIFRYTHKCDVEPGKMIRCFLCSKSRGDPIRLQFHFRRDHMKQDGGWCEVCDKKFTDAKTFKAHMKKHNNFDELFICAYCDKR